MVRIIVKHGKSKHEIELDTAESVETFKTQLWTLTGVYDFKTLTYSYMPFSGVPLERQKIMGKKVWKGPLKDSETLSAYTIKEGALVTLTHRHLVNKLTSVNRC
jgi:hypothetical protein